ncbi:MAG TPA: class I adenylate-forming enzyme family protein [Streptosporangiaceae bacterium]|nr:class I adenylate-forming enzyme family protein [Streptosporangiaceae bacterium]
MRAISIRAALAADPDVGAGNVLMKLVEHGAALDGPGITFDTDLDGYPAWEPLTLGMLRDRVAARAQWLFQYGIRPRDPVAVYVASAADCLLSFMALTWLGAIPALMNGNMPADVAAGYIGRLRGVGVIADAAHLDALNGLHLGVPIIGDAATLGSGDPARAPAHYKHAAEDPIAITHSSGTTRVPAAVVHSHASLFAATRLVHLATPRTEHTERTLCVLPAAHAAGIISHQQALCNRHELAYLSAQGGDGIGGPFDGSGAIVLDAIARWRPTGVYGFAVTWAELARYDLSAWDLSSVTLWFNTGDCAHEAHIRRLVAAGSHLEVTRSGVVRVPGSKFIDGIGSTEMGHSAFQAVHRPGTTRYGRCVGKPYDFAEIALLDLDTGAEVPVGHVGHVGLKSPTLAPSYWNDSVATYRNRFRGYYLTGDLMYRDDDGYYYHVDRAIDSVDLGGGNWLYTAMSEERILKRCPDVRDCTVVAGRIGGKIVTDVLLLLGASANSDADRTEAVKEALGPVAAATLRQIDVVSDDDITVGPTGKVRKFLMRQKHMQAAAS